MSESLSLETIVPYLVEHNTSIVSALVLLIILLSMFLGFRSFLSAKNADKFGGQESPSLGQLEETIKKLLDRAEQVPTPAQAGAGVSAENTMLLQEIENLRDSLAEKQVQIELIERKSSSEPALSGPGLSEVEKEALGSQVKDLQARLSEYEIISEDIADLSFFREENAKLTKELETLKKAGPVAQAAQVQRPEPENDLPDVGQDLVDKLLEQANSILTPPATEPSAIGKSTDLDVDKMVAEAAALVTSGVKEDKNALEETIDPDKLLAEAAGMDGKINPEDAKLMGEFEDFMKKGGVG